MKRALVLILLLAGGPGVAGGAGVEAPVSETPPPGAQNVDTLVDDLRARLGRLESLRADFRQRVTDTEGYELQALAGEMTVARPGYIHWQTEPPYEQLLVADAETLWLYDKDLEQVTVRPFMRDMVNSPAMLFIGDTADLEEKYRVNRAFGDQGREIYTLIPHDDSAVYQKMAVTFDGDTPVAMELWDSLGQITRIDFANVEMNRPVSPSRFRFTIPPGVDVLYND